MKKDRITIDNFRDMGGLNTPYGKIKEGKLYRTSTLVAKTEADKYFIEGLDLDCILDYRTTDEALENPDYVPEGVEYLHVPILREDGALVGLTDKAKLKFLRATPEMSKALIEGISATYKEMPFSLGYNELFKRMDEGKTIAFHCTAGKDRTGISAMLIEMAFDRDLDDIKYEYMLSNDMRYATNIRIKRIMKMVFAPKHAIDACWYALTNHIENFEVALALILEKYGTFKNYLKEHFGVTEERIAKWREFYIED